MLKICQCNRKVIDNFRLICCLLLLQPKTSDIVLLLQKPCNSLLLLGDQCLGRRGDMLHEFLDLLGKVVGTDCDAVSTQDHLGPVGAVPNSTRHRYNNLDLKRLANLTRMGLGLTRMVWGRGSFGRRRGRSSPAVRNGESTALEIVDLSGDGRSMDRLFPLGGGPGRGTVVLPGHGRLDSRSFHRLVLPQGGQTRS